MNFSTSVLYLSVCIYVAWSALVVQGALASSVTSYQLAALQQIYTSTRGTHWTTSTNWLTGDPCGGGNQSWYGLTKGDGVEPCDDVIEGIILPENNLIGELPNIFDAFSSLQVANFSGPKFKSTTNLKRISGTVPPSLFLPPKIRHVEMRHNLFDAFQMESVCNASTLKALEMGSNLIVATLPTCLGNLSALEVLEIENNNFVGDLFPMGGMHSLEVMLATLAFGQTTYTRPFPFELFELSGLRVASLGHLGLLGNLSVAFTNISTLEVLNLKDNNLYGTVPDSLWLNNLQLRFVSLGFNVLEGTVPALTHLSRLDTLMLDFSDFTGSFHGLPDGLYNVDISNNSFTGSLPDLPPSLANIIARGNQFSGTIPESWCGSLRQVLDISKNQITGTLPSCFRHLPAQTNLLAFSNHLEGTIPAFVHPVTVIELSENRMTGTVPYISFEFMRIFSVNDNLLSGTIPDSYFDYDQYLERFLLDNNSFTGTIPSNIPECCPLLRAFSIYNNSFSGSVPNLCPLNTFDIAINPLLLCPLPSCCEAHPSCSALEPCHICTPPCRDPYFPPPPSPNSDQSPSPSPTPSPSPSPSPESSQLESIYTRPVFFSILGGVLLIAMFSGTIFFLFQRRNRAKEETYRRLSSDQRGEKDADENSNNVDGSDDVWGGRIGSRIEGSQKSRGSRMKNGYQKEVRHIDI